MPAITFSSPGARLSRRKFSVRESLLDEYSLAVQPERDAVALVDMQSVQVCIWGPNSPTSLRTQPALRDRSTPQVQRIRCTARYPAECHALQRTMCELVDACGTQDRPVMLETCAGFGFEWATAALALRPELPQVYQSS